MTATTRVTGTDVVQAMRSGEWLRTQWIARVASGLDAGPWQPAVGHATRRVLGELERAGVVERRDAEEIRTGHIGNVEAAVALPRVEWRLIRGVTPPARPQLNGFGAVSTSHNTPQTQVQSQSRRPDSNRRPRHYESTVPVPPRPQNAANDDMGGRGESPQDPHGQAKRPQNAPSSKHLIAGVAAAPRSRLSEVMAKAREMHDRQADELGHLCAVHSSDDDCDGSPFCHSYCGRKIPAQFDNSGPECIVCNDLFFQAGTGG